MIRSQILTGAALLALLSTPVAAQQGGMSGMGGMNGMKGMQMGGMQHGAMAGMPSQSGQAAFAAISEVVRILEADSTTDWSKVNLEALRQHLIDMDLVTMQSKVAQAEVPAGLSMDITGDATVAAAVRRMVGMHAMMLPEAGAWDARATEIAGGMRLVVTAKDPADAALVAKIRGLGFIGLMTEGEHHAMHHLMVARGGSMEMHH